MGYDDTAVASLLPLPLSSVDSGAREIGRAAVSLLSEIMQKQTTSPKKILLKPVLKVRRSTVSEK